MLKRKPFIVMWLVVDLLVSARVSCRDIRRSTTFEVKDFYEREGCLFERERLREENTITVNNNNLWCYWKG